MKQNYQWFLLLIVVVAVPAFGCNNEKGQSEIVAKMDAKTVLVDHQQEKLLDKNVLTGNWIRSDGEYKIQISELHEDGKMNAGYFNPKSINVSQAQWKNEGGFLKIYIEMRDENYPGSNYSLIYLPEQNILTGEYYQAIERNKYKVEFARAK